MTKRSDFGKQNSTLGSVVTLAMFLDLIERPKGHKGPTVTPFGWFEVGDKERSSFPLKSQISRSLEQ